MPQKKKKCVELNQGVLEHAGLSPVPPCSAFAACGTVTRGESQSVLVTVHGSAPGCRLWPVAGDVLFDQLSRGFRQEEVNVHKLSGRTPLGGPIALCLPVYFHR